MKRLTTDTPKGCLEGMLNFAIAKDNKVFLADENGEYNVDLCEYVSRLAKAKGYDFSPEDIMEEGLFEYYQEDFAVLYCLAVQAAELRERLKLYEDKLENGTMIELPCKVGDKIYRITSNSIREETVLRIRVDCIKNKITLIISTEYLAYASEYINEIMFFTKDEAEARLKELQDG